MGFKIVVNRCYGGFGVSERGVEWLLSNGANPAQVMVRDSGLTGISWRFTTCLLERHDPLLVKMVETLGEEADGENAALEIKEINQPLYRIKENDGLEWVEEPAHVKWDDASKLEGE